MIPTEIYALAEKGGWLPADILHTGNYIADTKFRDCTAALDPAFFQALGKALGWVHVVCMECSTKVPPFRECNCDDDVTPDPMHAWRWYAHRFYELTLTGQPTETFWEELLKDTTQGWEKEFDETFVNGTVMDLGPTDQLAISWRLSKRQREAFKAFITKTLATQRENDRERVEKFIDSNDDGMWSGRETADAILQILKGKEI